MKPEDLVDALKELEREKGISFETILNGLEEAMASALKSYMRGGAAAAEEDDDLTDVRMTLDPATGQMAAFLRTYDEDGNLVKEEEIPVPGDFMGRIGAQTAKQVIVQKLRDAEREMTYEEFSGREGDVVTGIVQFSQHRFTLLDLGKVEALIPAQEQVPSEPYRPGERLKAYIFEVRRTGKGPQIIVSRTHPNLLRKLFELEVPEIADGLVEIKAIAREPGHRSKIAVASNEPGVDPVGACVGPKGSRVRMVVNELRGEKIDVVLWSDDPRQLVSNALAPAKVKEVKIDDENHAALVIVPDYQLSLAIGKEGQNARLAARLTGLRIDIKSEAQHTEDQATAREAPPEEPAQQEPAQEEESPAETAEPPAPEASGQSPAVEAPEDPAAVVEERP